MFPTRVFSVEGLDYGGNLNCNYTYLQVTTRSYQAKITLEKVNDNTRGQDTTMSSKLDEAKQTIENVKKSMQQRPKYEFGGPFGVLFQYLFVPFITIAIVSSYGKKKSELLKVFPTLCCT